MPPESARDDVTRILNAARSGDEAVARVTPLIYDELRRLAQVHLGRERADHTLQATALVHEAFLRLVDQSRVEYQGRAHFLAIASRMVRRVLVDHARERARLKRGGDRIQIDLDASSLPASTRWMDILEVDEALSALAAAHPRPALVVEYRFFGGMSVPECARLLDVSTRTIEGDWVIARAWLTRRLRDHDDDT